MEYTIRGSKIEGLLAERLDWLRTTAIPGLQGVVVYTEQGVFYSEIYDGKVLAEDKSAKPIPREKLNETTQGLLEAVTKQNGKHGFKNFNGYGSTPQ